MSEQLSVHGLSFISISVRFEHISDLPEKAELGGVLQDTSAQFDSRQIHTVLEILFK